MDRLIDWLSAQIPNGDEASITHGDFRIDNLIFDPIEPRIVAVLDWELSTIGNPLSDFAYHAMMYHMPPDIVVRRPEVLHLTGLPGNARNLTVAMAEFRHSAGLIGGGGRIGSRFCIKLADRPKSAILPT